MTDPCCCQIRGGPQAESQADAIVPSNPCMRGPLDSRAYPTSPAFPGLRSWKKPCLFTHQTGSACSDREESRRGKEIYGKGEI